MSGRHNYKGRIRYIYHIRDLMIPYERYETASAPRTRKKRESAIRDKVLDFLVSRLPESVCLKDISKKLYGKKSGSGTSLVITALLNLSDDKLVDVLDKDMYRARVP